MKKTSIIYTVAIALWGLTACTSDSLVDVKPQEQPAAKNVYQVCIPATFEGGADTRAVTIDGTTISSTFSTQEAVYVFNQTKNAMLGGNLTPANISSDEHSCDLTGTLTGTIEADDQLVLLYNLSSCDRDNIENNKFAYGQQSGTTSELVDGAMATVTAASNNTDSGLAISSSSPALFQNVQSIFRFKFVNESDNPITVAQLDIESGNLSENYFPLRQSPYMTGITGIQITPLTPTADYLYGSLCFDESGSGNELTFTVVDDNGWEYTGTKAAPTGGFKNGKYYYNSAPIQLERMRVKPNITWTSVQENMSQEPSPDNHYYFVIGPGYGSEPADITISGTSLGYYFNIDSKATVTLDNLTAALFEDQSYGFIVGTGKIIDLVVNGTNTISCKNGGQTISCDKLKLSGNGTLTVTSTYPDRCGIQCSNYPQNGIYYYDPTVETDVSTELAASGYKVVRSPRVDGPDNNNDNQPDYYTWTYTVTQYTTGRAEYVSTELE